MSEIAAVVALLALVVAGVAARWALPHLGFRG